MKSAVLMWQLNLAPTLRARLSFEIGTLQALHLVRQLNRICKHNVLQMTLVSWSFNLTDWFSKLQTMQTIQVLSLRRLSGILRSLQSSQVHLSVTIWITNLAVDTAEDCILRCKQQRRSKISMATATGVCRSVTPEVFLHLMQTFFCRWMRESVIMAVRQWTRKVNAQIRKTMEVGQQLLTMELESLEASQEMQQGNTLSTNMSRKTSLKLLMSVLSHLRVNCKLLAIQRWRHNLELCIVSQCEQSGNKQKAAWLLRASYSSQYLGISSKMVSQISPTWQMQAKLCSASRRLDIYKTTQEQLETEVEMLKKSLEELFDRVDKDPQLAQNFEDKELCTVVNMDKIGEELGTDCQWLGELTIRDMIDICASAE